MPRTLTVHFLPLLTTPDRLAGATVVVIDILRATTTITTALVAGAEQVVACLEVDAARQIAARTTGKKSLLAGERGGLPIEGFDLGNSPSEFTPQRVAGQTIVFTTTNGTKALLQCHQAAEVWIGAFVNLTAICRAADGVESLHLLCAGTRGEITREDALFAGAVADRLLTAETELNDQALIARDLWRSCEIASGDERSVKMLVEQLRATQGGRNLHRIGLDADLYDAAAIDRYAVIPKWNGQTGAIRI